MRAETKKLIEETIAKAEATGDSQLVMKVLGMYKAILDLTAEIIELKGILRKDYEAPSAQEVECDGKVTIEISGEEIAEAIHEKIQRRLDESMK